MNQKKQRTLAIFALTVALLATSIAYATLSAALKVSGSATKKGGTWCQQMSIDEKFTPKTTGDGKMTSNPTFANNTLSFGISLSKPNDSVEFSFNLVNCGNIDASIKTLTGSLNGVSWDKQATSKSDDIICSLSYDGKILSTTTTTVSGTSALSSLNLPASAKRKVTARCEYYEKAETVSEANKELIFKASFNYQQTYTK